MLSPPTPTEEACPRIKAHLTSLEPLVFRGQQWIASTTSECPPTDHALCQREATWRFVTFNILFDRCLREAYREPTLHAEERFEHALAALERTRADVIGLQEVTPHFIHHLMCSPWVRSHYYLSSNALHPSLQPYGQMFLSRYPFRQVYSYSFGPTSIKRVLLASIEAPTCTWIFANVHLPADHVGPNADLKLDRKQRMGQLKRILSLMNTLQADLEGSARHLSIVCAMLGDFNFGDEPSAGEENQLLLEHQFRDVWLTKRKHSVSDKDDYTLDPQRNGVAAALSPRLCRSRSDRIFIRSSHWKTVDQRLIGQTEFPIETEKGHGVSAMNISDHFGVFVQVTNTTPSR